MNPVSRPPISLQGLMYDYYRTNDDTFSGIIDFKKNTMAFDYFKGPQK